MQSVSSIVNNDGCMVSAPRLAHDKDVLLLTTVAVAVGMVA